MPRRVHIKPGEITELVLEGSVCLRVFADREEYGEYDILVDMTAQTFGYRWGEKARAEINQIDQEGA